MPFCSRAAPSTIARGCAALDSTGCRRRRLYKGVRSVRQPLAGLADRNVDGLPAAQPRAFRQRGSGSSLTSATRPRTCLYTYQAHAPIQISQPKPSIQRVSQPTTTNNNAHQNERIIQA